MFAVGGTGEEGIGFTIKVSVHNDIQLFASFLTTKVYLPGSKFDTEKFEPEPELVIFPGLIVSVHEPEGKLLKAIIAFVLAHVG
jgi:hypothetical protein